MAHNLMNDSAYAGRKAAWHGLGQVLPDATTMDELRIAAGITYRFEKTPVFFEVETMTDSWHHQFPGHSVLTKDGLTPLAIVSDDYEFFQPYELAESMDELLSAVPAWKPETCLALGNGITTIYCIALGEWDIANDHLRDYLLVTDTVDAKHALTMATTPVRTVCENTLRLGLRQATSKLALRHTVGHVSGYKAAIKQVKESQDAVRQALITLSKINWTPERFDDYLDKVYKTDDDGLKVRMSDLKDQSRGFMIKMVADDGLRLTAYCGFNAVSEALEHGIGLTGRTGVARSLLLGTGSTSLLLKRAYELAVV